MLSDLDGGVLFVVLEGLFKSVLYASCANIVENIAIFGWVADVNDMRFGEFVLHTEEYLEC